MFAHFLSVRVRCKHKVHFFKNDKPLCGAKNVIKDRDYTWKALENKRCKTCERILKMGV